LEGKIESLIGRSPYDRKKMAIVRKNGKNAITNYKTLKIFKNVASLVQCNLETGRTHQIRVHLSSKGCPLIGEQLYGKNKRLEFKSIDEDIREYVNSFSRQALHAKSLGFVHPRSGQFLQFDSDLPEDFLQLLATLEKI